jgi:DNA-binding NtrC family response regulator
MSRLSDGIAEQSKMDPGQQQAVAGVQAGPGNDEGSDAPILSLRSVRAQVESTAILGALKRTGWNRKQAARLLRISYRGLLYKIRQHNLRPTAEQG